MLDDHLNPYAPPRTLDPPTEEQPEARLGIYQPRLAPRDMTDVLLGLGIGVLGAMILYGVPLGLLMLFKAPAYLAPIAVLSVLAAAILIVVSGIQKMTLTPDGIVAHRILLPSIKVAWSDVRQIRELNRREALRYAFLLPHRCCSQSLTYRGHLRFETAKLYFVFAPQELDAFYETLRSLELQLEDGQAWRGPGRSEQAPV